MTPRDDADDLVVARTFGTELEAQTARAVLEARGIAAQVLADTGSGMLPMLPVLFPVRLLVLRGDLPEAMAALDGGGELRDDDWSATGDPWSADDEEGDG